MQFLIFAWGGLAIQYTVYSLQALLLIVIHYNLPTCDSVQAYAHHNVTLQNKTVVTVSKEVTELTEVKIATVVKVVTELTEWTQITEVIVVRLVTE